MAKPPKKQKKNTPVSLALREKCVEYLANTDPSKWNFAHLWGGDKAQLSALGHLWMKALQDIIDDTDDNNKYRAAVTARDRYKARKHLPAASRNKKSKPEGIKNTLKQRQKSFTEPSKLAEPPPSYESSQGTPPCDVKKISVPRRLHEQHLALGEDRKWHLPSGRSVEDVLFASVVSRSEDSRRLDQPPKETLAHSYILDTDDEDIKSLFNKDGEWDAIISRLQTLPILERTLEPFMHKFADAKTPAELRGLLASNPYLLPGETYSPDTHGDKEWVHYVFTSLLLFYEGSHLSRPHLEAWYQINIWGPIFDRCFYHIPGMDVKRTESQSPHNSDRKNTATVLARKAIGSRYDAIIAHGCTEYGAVEDSREFEPKKWQVDNLKLAKVLHDQLRALERRVRHDREVLGRFRCAGFITAALDCQTIFLQYGDGSVCLLSRGGRSPVSEDGNMVPLASLIAVMANVWRMREAVRTSVHNLEAYLANTEALFRAAVDHTVLIPAILPTCFDTDSEL